MAEYKISCITYPDGTEKFMIDEVRNHSWGNTHHPIMHPEHSQVGLRFVPVMLTREDLENALTQRKIT